MLSEMDSTLQPERQKQSSCDGGVGRGAGRRADGLTVGDGGELQDRVEGTLQVGQLV